MLIAHIALNSILFLDEIQSVPDALPSLRYFNEDMPDLPVVCAGSLLETLLIDHNFSMPVGRVEYLHMGPMTFTEFLDALGEVKLIQQIRFYELGQTIGTISHKRLLELLRIYFFVGGMPEAVDIYARTKRISGIIDIHRSIIETYQDDFPKYIGNRDKSRVLTVFNAIAQNVGRKIKYSSISRGDQSSVIKKDIELLCLAKIAAKVTHSHCSGLPLQADIKPEIFKLLFLDIGLMNAICGLTWDALVRSDDQSLINEGSMAEQFIGQHLLDILSQSTNKNLTYWLREGKANNAELDYVIALNGRIIPIEVKSGTKGTLKSLHQFAGEKDINMAVRFDLCQPTSQLVKTTIQHDKTRKAVEYTLHSLPLYLVEKLPDLV